MKRNLYALAMTFVSLASSANPVQDLKTFCAGQVAEHVVRKSSFFVSECRIDSGWAIILFPNGKDLGIYGEFSATGLQANGSEVTLRDGKAQLGELMIGGMATQLRQQQIVYSLLRRPFELIASSHIKAVLLKRPTEDCIL